MNLTLVAGSQCERILHKKEIQKCLRPLLNISKCNDHRKSFCNDCLSKRHPDPQYVSEIELQCFRM